MDMVHITKENMHVCVISLNDCKQTCTQTSELTSNEMRINLLSFFSQTTFYEVEKYIYM